jgi:hypothetical protein
MTAVFPGAIPSYTNPTASMTLGSANHDQLHANVNDDVVQIATKLGATDSPASDVPVINKVLGSLANGKSGWLSVITAMIAAGAVSQIGSAVGATSNPTSVATTAADVNDMSVTLTTTAGAAQFAIFRTSFSHSVATATVLIAINETASGDLGTADLTVSTANHIRSLITFVPYVGLSAGSHTWKGRGWNDAGATLTYRTVNRSLFVVEFKR